ncbi:MAG TPA: glycosyltransferase family 2 protein [Blastocatellia bacterium]|nr:glycosyltransferase family 2 protein [Blastocatellia bacterium]
METAIDSIALPVHQSDPIAPLRASVVIVNYNAGEKLLRCLESVTRSADEDCEIVVVDNASTDGIADIIGRDFPQVILVRSGVNAGFGAGSNLGVKHARGDYIIFLNPDTVVERGWIEALLAPLDLDARAGLTTAKILLVDDPSRINACGNDVHFTGLTLCRGLGRSREQFDEPEEVGAVSGAAFAIRRELFASLGGFDEDTFLYMEDTDLSWRARLSGWRCVYAPESIVLHEYSLRITPKKIFYQERNRYLMLLKNLRWPTLVILAPALVLAEAITWSFVVLRDRANFRNKLRAYGWILSNRRLIMKKRKAVQSLRKATDRELLQHTTYNLDFDQAASGVAAKLARFVFNPIFFVLKNITMAIVWW